ncbi:hypothetical protein [Chitinibacter sp. ZOR0017]|uniref:hypothetical protein n=1 Tax=Chitinibacter sp. ZOR0017 TaxID=1339254 RepID=UPI0012E06833|nr:hypothetical protein [Chitinibacter sp. ZOR0017]
MRTHLEFVSPHFPPYDDEFETVNPNRYGKRLADFLAKELTADGFTIKNVIAEDWGWMVSLDNPKFTLWIGCGNYEEFDNGFLCFIEASTPFFANLFSKIDIEPAVEKLATAIESILLNSPKVTQLRWWNEDES